MTNTPSPTISGKAALAVVPVAICVVCFVTGQHWMIALGSSVATAACLWALQVACHSWSDARTEKPHLRLRDRSFAITVIAAMLGLVSGGVVGIAALIAGFHGNAPVVWLYLLGPVAWMLLLSGSETSFLYLLGILTPITWIAYWGFLIAGSARLTKWRIFSAKASVHGGDDDHDEPCKTGSTSLDVSETGFQRAILLALVHFAFAAAYHVCVGLD